MILWVVCGAMRGVGKTHFSKRLCAILPNSKYAKLGHHQLKKGKSENLFRGNDELASFINNHRESAENIVVETHSPVEQALAKITIFIDAAAPTEETRFDAGSLAASADIYVGKNSSFAAWAACLCAKLHSAELTEAILSILADQKRRNSGAQLSVRSKIWLVNEENQHVFGPGLASLLENVEHLGSLQAAVDATELSYRHLWGEIKRAEKELGYKLLIRKPGGADGGSSSVSLEGKRVLALYQRLAERVALGADAGFAELQPLAPTSLKEKIHAI